MPSALLTLTISDGSSKKCISTHLKCKVLLYAVTAESDESNRFSMYNDQIKTDIELVFSHRCYN